MQCASSTATKLTGCRPSEREEPVAALADEPLGRDVENGIGRRESRRDAAFSSGVSALWTQAAGTPLPTSVSTWSFISEISGETTSASAVVDERRRLEAQRLAAAGGQDDERVACRQHGVHRLALERAEGRVAPVPLEDLGQRHRGQCSARAQGAQTTDIARTAASSF